MELNTGLANLLKVLFNLTSLISNKEYICFANIVLINLSSYCKQKNRLLTLSVLYLE